MSMCNFWKNSLKFQPVCFTQQKLRVASALSAGKKERLYFEVFPRALPQMEFSPCASLLPFALKEYIVLFPQLVVKGMYHYLTYFHIFPGEKTDGSSIKGPLVVALDWWFGYGFEPLVLAEDK